MLAILATAAGFLALAGPAQAQISGSIGGDVVAQRPLPVLGGPDKDATPMFWWGVDSQIVWFAG